MLDLNRRLERKSTRRSDDMKNLYCCYSIHLRDFLYKHGLRYELCALNPNSKTMFWVYIRTEQLNDLLSKWSTEK